MGYENPDLVRLVAARTKAYRKLISQDKAVKSRQMVQNMFVLSHASPERPMDVLEIGGACGGTYFELDHMLPELVRKWSVVEVASTAKAGKSAFQDERLKFYSDLNAAVAGLENRDLLMAQGVLQCMPDPFRAMKAWFGFGFTYVYITRLEVSNELEHPVIVKLLDRLSANGPGPFPNGFSDRDISYPATMFPFDAIASHIPDSYVTVFSFIESKDRPKLMGSQVVNTRKVGFLFKREVPFYKEVE